MNKSDLEKMKKCEEEYNKFFEDTPFQRKIDKIARDIRERQDNALAMEFTQKIGQMLRENGVVPHITEYKTEMECTGNSIKQRYGVEFDSLDFTEHDKKFKDEIARLNHDLREAEQRANELEEIYKRERKVIDNLYCRCSKRAVAPFMSRKYECLRVIECEELKQSYADKPHIHIIGLREFGGEQYMRYSDVEDLIRELEEC